jgi:hypothetical protein
MGTWETSQDLFEVREYAENFGWFICLLNMEALYHLKKLYSQCYKIEAHYRSYYRFENLISLP